MTNPDPASTEGVFWFNPEMERHPLVVGFHAQEAPKLEDIGEVVHELMQNQAAEWADRLLGLHTELDSDGVRDRVGGMVLTLIAYGWRIGRAAAAHFGEPLTDDPDWDDLVRTVDEIAEALDVNDLPDPVVHLVESARWNTHRHVTKFLPDLGEMKAGSQLWVDVTSLLDACIRYGYSIVAAQVFLARSSRPTSEVLGPWVVQRDERGAAWVNARDPGTVHSQGRVGAGEVVVGHGRFGDDVVVIELEQARVLADAWEAVRAQTIEDAIAGLPEPYRSDVTDRREAAAEDGREFDLDSLSWWALEGGLEWPNQQMLALLPDDLIDRLGKRSFSGVSGPCVTIDLSRREELVSALRSYGFRVVEDDVLTKAACGGDP